MNVTCSAEPCPVILNATCVFYEGNTLVYTGIVTNDNLQTALQKIDQKFQDSNLGYIFTNGIEQLAPGQPVMLGGALVKDTTIGGLYNLAFAGTLEASALITTGGTSTDFVKGDGSLDPTSYQPAGNYITNLTGDVLASGPGSVAATLATVFGSPGTYGNSGSVPSITVDSKGRVTNVTPTPINYPAQSLSFVGDVDGFGFTGSPVTLTLDTVNTDVYGSNNFLKFAVNGKGLITSATPVSDGDITTALGYVPVDNIIELSINGVAHNLTANRSWNVGTVTGVSIIAGTGLNASISNPNTTPSISIVNTAPDQTVVLNGGFGISVTGSYPNFTITNDYPDITGGTVTTFSAGNLSPLFTTSVTNPTTTPALSFALSSAAANTVLAGPNGGSGTPTYRALVAADLPSLSYISNISVSAPLATTGGLTPTLSISQAGASTDGYLSSADWTTFNSKQPAGNYITDLTGDGTASGPGSAGFTLATVNATTGTFGSSTQVPVITVNGKGLVTCVTTDTISGSLEFVGDVTGVGSTGACTTLTLATVNNDVYTSETLLNVAVNGKGLITSANPTTAGDICSTLGYTPEDVANKSTCTSLGVSNTLYPTQLAVKTYVDNATSGGIILQGDWNANTNTPNISGTTTTGWAWRVSVPGTTNLGGITDWQIGDLAVKSATGWVKIDNSDGVTSVFGRFGAVVATTGDYLTCQVTECNDLYFTNARARAAVGHTVPLTYNSTTGVFGITQSNATTDGYLSATDWTTFNDKQPALGYTPVNQTRQLTINGTTYDLTADRSWSVGTVTSVTGSAPLASSGGTTPNLTISQSGTASDGYLSSTDWNHFNSHTSCTGTVTCVAACTSTTGVSITGSPITSSGTLGFNIATASSVCTGLLSSADWNTFNSHTSCSGTVTSVGLTSSTTGVSIACSPVTSSGNISLNIATASSLCTGLLTSADWNSFNSRTSCTGTVTCVNATGTNISVTGSPITTSGTLAISLSGANVCSALGYTPYNATNPNGYTTCVGTVTSVGIVATNINVCSSPVTTSGNICLNLTGANVCSALGYTPAPSSALSSYLPLAGGTMSGSIAMGGNSITGSNNITYSGANTYTGAAGSYALNLATNDGYASMRVISNNMGSSPFNDGMYIGYGNASSGITRIFGGGATSGGIIVSGSGINSVSIAGNVVLNAANYNDYSPTKTGGGASGTWGINISGDAATVDGYSASTSTLGNHIVVRDGNGYIFGNYVNMTDDGNPGSGTAITSFITKQGDNYYRSVSPTNAMSCIRGVASGTWGINVTGTSSRFASGQSNWSGTGIIDSVVGLMAWKNYGNSHVIFDASQGTSPSGGGVSQTNSTVQWTPTYPTLMGWNGSQTYGVRVDCARGADVASNSNLLNGISSTQIFNNMGQSHGTYQDFNSVGNFGVRYLQGSTNGPQSGQFYGFTLGLGDDYSINQYGSQFYWMRNTTNPYIWIRYLEGGSWGSWTKGAAGYADTAGSANSACVANTACNVLFTTGGATCSTVRNGNNNLITSNGCWSFVAGRYNTMESQDSAIAGGADNVDRSAGGTGNFIGAGNHNEHGTPLGVGASTSSYSFIGAGLFNCVTSNCSSIVGGASNKIGGFPTTDGNGSFIGGGDGNYIYVGPYNVIGGGRGNAIDQNIGYNSYGFVGGGYGNCINASCGTIGGGGFNYITGYASTIAGGQYNCNFGNTSFIGGGQYNGILSGCAFIGTIAGGNNNIIGGGAYNFVGGGSFNYIYGSASASSIIGGQSNTVGGGCGGTCNIHVIGGGISGTVNNYTYVNNLCQVGGGLSDCRVKNNICNTGFGLNEILQLRPVSYCFNGDTSKKFGFIAQEIQEVIPELVSFNPVEKLGPNNERTIFGDGEPLLEFDKDAIFASYVNAFKDLYKLNQELEARVSALEEALKAK